MRRHIRKLVHHIKNRVRRKRMDNTLSSQPAKPVQSNVTPKLFGFKLTRIHLIFLSLVVLAVVLTIIIVVFSFISGKKPIQLPGQGPKLVFAPPQKLPSSFNPTSQKGPFTCPIALSFCKDEKMYKNNLLSGNAGIGAAAYAVFEGKLTALTTLYPIENNKKDEFTTLVLTDLNKGLTAYYRFKGVASAKTEVKEGEKVATLSGKSLPMYKDNSFVFEMIKLDVNGVQSLVNLKPADFK